MLPTGCSANGRHAFSLDGVAWRSVPPISHDSRLIGVIVVVVVVVVVVIVVVVIVVIVIVTVLYCRCAHHQIRQ